MVNPRKRDTREYVGEELSCKRKSGTDTWTCKIKKGVGKWEQISKTTDKILHIRSDDVRHVFDKEGKDEGIIIVPSNSKKIDVEVFEAGNLVSIQVKNKKRKM